MSGNEESIEVDGTRVFNGHPVVSVEKLMERMGFHPAQVVQSADGTVLRQLGEVLREVWFQASWQAYRIGRYQLGRQLADEPMTRREWGERWFGNWECAREEGATREVAWALADEKTIQELGPRPEESV